MYLEGVGVAGWGEWCGHSGQQSLRVVKMGCKISIVTVNILISARSKFCIIELQNNSVSGSDLRS